MDVLSAGVLLDSITPDQRQIINELLPNGWNLLAHVMAFAIIFAVVTCLVWRPLNAALAKRAGYINAKIREAEKDRELAAAVHSEIQAEVEKTKIESARIIEASRLEGYRVREELEQQAKMYADRLKQDARDDVAKQELALRQKINDEIVAVAFTAAERIVKKKVDTEENKKLVEEFIDTLGSARRG